VLLSLQVYWANAFILPK
jgi:hypothetical protein